MKISLAQIDVEAGNPHMNVAKMLHHIGIAKKEGVDLIVFPEMSVGGYLLSDRWLDDEFCRTLTSYNNTLRDASKGIALAYGNVFIDPNQSNKDGRTRKYNAVYFYQDGLPVGRSKEPKILPVGVQPKVLLPQYRVFDDGRYFFSLVDVSLQYKVSLKELLYPFRITVKGEQHLIGFEVCEDMWGTHYLENQSPISPAKILQENGAEVVINLSASPWTPNKHSARTRQLSLQASHYPNVSIPRLYVNCVGAQNIGKSIVTFEGISSAYNSLGEPLRWLETPYKEGVLTVNQEELKLPSSRQYEERSLTEQKFKAIIRGLKHIPDMTGVEVPKFIIGLSGGIDSALVLCLLEQAFGKEAVTAINMPSRYNSEATKSVASKLAEALGVQLLSIPIESIKIAVEQTLEQSLGVNSLKPLHRENIQAKIRGTDLLSNLAASTNAFFTNNGNKLEVAQGYATLYGDVGGVIAPIGDLLKTEVYDLAFYLNEQIYGAEVIPQDILPDKHYQFSENKIKPTAELAHNQEDPFDVLYHSKLLEQLVNFKPTSLVTLLEWYDQKILEKRLSLPDNYLSSIGLKNAKMFIDDLERFYKNIANSTFKRIQSPPIIVLSRSAFGYDYRESQSTVLFSQKYLRLKKIMLTNEG